ncbi:MAG: AAA family ATPase [Hydrogenophilales bacterium]|nr:AAA family ATPase [Hydrogenophilales bacterium]
MEVTGKVTLRNYRCFNWDNPATLEFGNGFTALVGANNSGKSAALRSIYELRNIWPALRNALSPATGYRAGVQPLGVADVAELANDHDAEKFEVLIQISDSHQPRSLSELVAFLISAEYDVRAQLLTVKYFQAIDSTGNIQTFDRTLLQTVAGTQPEATLLRYTDGRAVDFSKMFAFILDLHNSKYFPAFRNAINEGAGSYYDIPVGTALVGSWDVWKAGAVRAHKIAISRIEREIADLLGFRSLQINADQSGKTFDVIINDRPMKLYEVGAGVAQLIIVFAAALVHQPPYILIDEPELSLHPSLQLSFLSTLGSYVKKGLLFSTHSIGLARSTASRIFTVQRLQDGISSMSPLGEKTKNFTEWLGELSYSSRVELGCEGLILVEGPSEVLCFQEFLRKLRKDHRFVLMQLGGASLINGGIAPHLEEIKRLIDDPSKIHIVIDSEKRSADEPLASDREAFLTVCKSLGVNAWATERRATENYFESNGIQKALGNGYQPLEPYQKLKDAIKPWHKSNNWKIAKEMSLDDIRDTDLGRFFMEL